MIIFINYSFYKSSWIQYLRMHHYLKWSKKNLLTTFLNEEILSTLPSKKILSFQKNNSHLFPHFQLLMISATYPIWLFSVIGPNLSSFAVLCFVVILFNNISNYSRIEYFYRWLFNSMFAFNYRLIFCNTSVNKYIICIVIWIVLLNYFKMFQFIITFFCIITDQ